jgi:hypothetical protein
VIDPRIIHEYRLIETTIIYSDHYPRVWQEDLVLLKVLHVLIPSCISTQAGSCLSCGKTHLELAMASYIRVYCLLNPSLEQK